MVNSIQLRMNPKQNYDLYIYTLDVRFLIHLADRYPRWNSIFRVFSITTWVTIFVSIIIFSSVFTFISSSKSIKKENVWKGSPFYPLNLWTVLLGGAFTTSQTNWNTRILIFSWIVFAICIGTIFQSFVTSYLVDPGFQYQVNTVKEATANFYLMFIPYINVFIHAARNNSYLPVKFEDALINVVGKSNTVIAVPRDIFVYGYKKFCKNNPPTFYMFEDTFRYNVYYYFNGNIEFLGLLKNVLRRLVESGIPDKLLKDFTDPKGTQEGIYQPTGLQDEYESLSVIHLQSVFLIYLFGSMISSLVFLFEIGITFVPKLIIICKKCRFNC